MSKHQCPYCQCGSETAAMPPEPPVGAWVRALKPKSGASAVFVDFHQEEGWGQPGTMPCGVWAAMWEEWGPLEVCGPWGRDL